ncbi:MAG: flagellar biosynthesis/type III secretory pathway chaperone [Candidatus Latescibacterota bacterium]|jgi:flagellar biosynthesis/type III secretory pathway chaperone
MMSEQLLVDLAALINDEIRAFHRLLAALQEEQRAIVEDDIEVIEQCVAVQQEVAVVAHHLEAKRVRIVGQLAEHLDMEPQNVSLSRLVEALEGPRAEELAQMREKLLELNGKIRSVSENNAFLIRQSLRYTERCLDILTAQSPTQRGVYGQFGKVRRSAGSRSFLNQTA